MARGFEWLPDYDADRSTAANNIKQTSSPLKVLLKTKNESFLLKAWIEHHSKIVGLNNIVIFDNCSDDANVEEVYRAYSDEVQIYRYSGFCDKIHVRSMHRDLYASLAASCSHYIFLDTDEFIGLYDSSAFKFGPEIVDFVDAGKCSVYPGTWLQNVLGHEDRFFVRNDHDLISGLKWGKPVIRSDWDLSDIMMHNVQAVDAGNSGSLEHRLFVFHRSLLSASQRISSNMRKLSSQGIIGAGDTISAVLGFDAGVKVPDNCRRYIDEIRALSKLPADAVGDIYGSLKVGGTGEVEFYNDGQRELVERFIAKPFLDWAV